jgi:hypothetical protein
MSFCPTPMLKFSRTPLVLMCETKECASKIFFFYYYHFKKLPPIPWDKLRVAFILKHNICLYSHVTICLINILSFLKPCPM